MPCWQTMKRHCLEDDTHLAFCTNSLFALPRSHYSFWLCTLSFNCIQVLVNLHLHRPVLEESLHCIMQNEPWTTHSSKTYNTRIFFVLVWIDKSVVLEYRTNAANQWLPQCSRTAILNLLTTRYQLIANTHEHFLFFLLWSSLLPIHLLMFSCTWCEFGCKMWKCWIDERFEQHSKKCL